MSEKTVSRGKFIVFEGGDGCGKSTQVKLLLRWLRGRGCAAVETWEPGGTRLGRRLRAQLLHGGDLAPRTEALLYAADRAEHISEIVMPALEAGIHVVQDRYIDSSIAYQGAGRALTGHEIAEINTWATDALTPDLTILLDLDPTAARARRSKRAADRIEREPDLFHTRVREQFLALSKQADKPYCVINASQPVKTVHKLILSCVNQLI